MPSSAFLTFRRTRVVLNLSARSSRYRLQASSSEPVATATARRSSISIATVSANRIRSRVGGIIKDHDVIAEVSNQISVDVCAGLFLEAIPDELPFFQIPLGLSRQPGARQIINEPLCRYVHD